MAANFYKPTTIAEALDLLDQYKDGAVIVNGGTDIVEKLGTHSVEPQAILYVADMEELQGVWEADGKIHLGGSVTYVQMMASPIIQKVPGMMKSLSHLGSLPVRQVATPAGNIGTAAPSADCTTMLTGLDAQAVLVSKQRGTRTVPVSNFFVRTYKNVMEPDELIKEIWFDAPVKGSGSGYYRLARRKAQDIGKVLVGASVQIENGVCQWAKIGLGALNATAVRGYSIEQALQGKAREDAEAVIDSIFPSEAGLRPSRFKRYKELTVQAAIKRAVMMAWDNATT